MFQVQQNLFSYFKTRETNLDRENTPLIMDTCTEILPLGHTSGVMGSKTPEKISETSTRLANVRVQMDNLNNTTTNIYDNVWE